MDLCVENDEEYVPWANSVKNFQIDKKWIRQKKKIDDSRGKNEM